MAVAEVVIGIVILVILWFLWKDRLAAKRRAAEVQARHDVGTAVRVAAERSQDPLVKAELTARADELQMVGGGFVEMPLAHDQEICPQCMRAYDGKACGACGWKK